MDPSLFFSFLVVDGKQVQIQGPSAISAKLESILDHAPAVQM